MAQHVVRLSIRSSKPNNYHMAQHVFVCVVAKRELGAASVEQLNMKYKSLLHVSCLLSGEKLINKDLKVSPKHQIICNGRAMLLYEFTLKLTCLVL
jgi:hypothetical protein